MFNDLQITFTYDWRLFAAVICLAVAAVIAFYLANVQHLRGRALVILTSLRILALLLVILLLFRPRISYERQRVARAPLVVALDRSQSMRISDRFNRARGMLLESESGVLARLARDFDVRLYQFAETAAPVSDPDDLLTMPADGDATALTSLREAVRGFGEDVPEGVVVLTDGVDTTGHDPVPGLRELGVRIHPVAVGRPLRGDEGYPDIWISDVETKRTVMVGNLTEITVYVDAADFGGQFAQVKLLDEGSQLAEGSVGLDNVKGTQEVKLRFTPQEEGTHTYRVQIPVDARESVAENNAYEFDLQVTAARVAVLYITAAPGQEFRFLKRALRADPDLDVLSLVEISPGLFLQEGEVAGLQLKGFPEDLTTLRAFDVVVLGDVDSTYFNDTQHQALRTFVAEGGALAATWGDAALNAGGWGETPIADVLPVRVGARDTRNGFVRGAFTMELTDAGRQHPILTGCVPLFTANDDLPPLQSAHRLGRPRPGADVLAVHPSATAADSDRPLPVLTVGEYGKGRALVFSCGPTWPWSFKLRSMGRDSPYHRLWGQAVRWLAREEAKQSGFEPGVAASIDRVRYAPGQVVKIFAHARDGVGALTDRAHVTAEVYRLEDRDAGIPDGAEPLARLELAHVPGTPGSYEGSYQPPAPGGYRLVVIGRLDDQELGRRKIDFRVGKPNLEFDRKDPDTALLKRLAAETGGRYATFGTIGQLLDHFHEANRHRREPVVIDLWNAPLFFVLFMLITTAEWILRKRLEMA